jgi:hypothetical protein
MGIARTACGRPRRGLVASSAALLAAGALACATAPEPEPSSPGTGSVQGMLRLVPREGVKPVKPGASPYADRRMADVTFVDYSKPGFAVVYLASGASPGGTAELEIRTTGVRTRLDPPHAAVGTGGKIAVRNGTGAAHVLSVPGIGMLQRLEPGQQVEIAAEQAGEQGLFLVDVPRSGSTVFVAPGPFSVVSHDGRFRLSGLSPGDHQLLAWHPRFPPAHAPLQIAAGRIVQLDLDMGVDQRDDVPASAPADLP